MSRTKKIRVLIVDDSYFFRESMASKLNRDPMIDVIGVASNAFEARDRILSLRPDVMTLDINMPHMNGIEFLNRMMPGYPMPVIVISGVDNVVFDALQAGAVDFVAKNTRADVGGINSIANEIIEKIKIAANANVRIKSNLGRPEPSVNISRLKNDKVIAIGASTGGTEATVKLLKSLPKDIPGIVIVQHMPVEFTGMYADRLNRICDIEVIEGRDRDEIKPGRAIIAPGDKHMRVVKKPGGGYRINCDYGDKVSGHIPSVNVLFDSVAKHVGDKSIGVILTGMGRDGANGLLKIRNVNGRTIGQNEKSCVVYGMPKAAYDLGAVERQLDIMDISAHLMKLVERS